MALMNGETDVSLGSFLRKIPRGLFPLRLSELLLQLGRFKQILAIDRLGIGQLVDLADGFLVEVFSFGHASTFAFLHDFR